MQEYPTITTLSESPLTPNVLWVGTDDGNVQVTRDGGKTWKNVASKVPGVPKATYVSRVVASKTGDGVALLSFDGHRGDDNNVYIFATNDYGESWKAIRNGIPDSAGSVHVVREHPRNTNLLFAGTEFGLWVSWDRGANWTALKNNFPTVPVDDIEIQARENDLVLGTHGRSIWVFDDLTPIEKMDSSVSASALTFFPLRPAMPYGALLSYYLKEVVPAEAPKKDKEEKDRKDAVEEKPTTNAKGEAAEKKEGKAKITVLDKDGKVIREMDGPGAAGVNRTNWDLRSNPPAEPTPEQQEAIAAGFGFGPRGPFVEPGEYTIKIKAGDKEASQEQWKKDAGKPNTTKIPDDIVKAADELQKKVDAVAEKFIRERQGLGNAGPPFEWKPDPLPNQVQNLLDALDEFVAAPSGQQREKLAELTPLVNDASAQVKKIADEELPALNKKMNDAGIPHIVPAPTQSRGGRGGEVESEQ